MAFRKLYPSITPYSTGYLDVDDTHSLYWEQSGNSDGVPVVFLHGGPGAGATQDHRRFFDPEFYRIIIFDQRGCGRSNPLGELKDNTPHHLTADIEALRLHFKIRKWHVCGGSWGSTLALLYAAKHPQSCASLILRSVSLMTRADIEWIVYGMRTVFPEVWQKFSDHVDGSDDLIEAYITRLTSEDQDIALAAGEAWSGYESACATLYPQSWTITSDEQHQRARIMALIETHYYKHFAFDDKDGILSLVDRFRHIPAVIVHGRYDMVTPISGAYDLHQKWPEADMIIVPDGGHSALDPAIRDRLIAATDNARSIR